jgi:hypothetical protein
MSAEYRAGVVRDLWGLPSLEVLPEGLTWPNVILWIAAAARPHAPERFYILLDAAGYRAVPPTGAFWDLSTRSQLDIAKRPKGKPGSRFARVFRTDWNNSAFYHPYDRVAAQSHPGWVKEQPHLLWTDCHTIVDYLEEFYSLLNSGDYLGT